MLGIHNYDQNEKFSVTYRQVPNYGPNTNQEIKVFFYYFSRTCLHKAPRDKSIPHRLLER